VLASLCTEKKVSPRAVRHTPALLAELQRRLIAEDVALAWKRA